MRDDCYFKITDQNRKKCTYPKLLGICLICDKYLKNEGNLVDQIKYIQYVVQRNHNQKALIISILAVLISAAALIISFLEFSAK